MAAASDYSPVIRELWPQRRVDNTVYEASPLLAFLPKDETFAEKTRHIAVQYGNPQGRSASFSVAQASLSSGAAAKFKDFQVTIVSDYAVGTLDSLTLERGKKDKAALVDAIDREVKGAIQEISNSISYDLYRSGTGARGVVGSYSTVTCTLATASDAYNFEPGMQIVAAATETGALRAGTGYVTLTSVDPIAGTLTASSNWTTDITSTAANDYLFARGDAMANSGTKAKLVGLGGWIPFTAPSASESFFGVDRSFHPTRLAGVRHDGSGDTDVQKDCLKLFTKMFNAANKRAKPSKVFMHPNKMESLLIALDSDRQRHKVDVPGTDLYFDAVRLATPFGEADFISDKYCPESYAYALTPESWTFASLDKAPHIIQHDGLDMLRQASSDGVEFRAVSRHQLYTDAPLYNGVVKLP